jgi:hypothetical protein
MTRQLSDDAKWKEGTFEWTRDKRTKKRAENERKKKAKHAKAGLKQCNVWIPANRTKELRDVAKLLRENPHMHPTLIEDDTADDETADE